MSDFRKMRKHTNVPCDISIFVYLFAVYLPLAFRRLTTTYFHFRIINNTTNQMPLFSNKNGNHRMLEMVVALSLVRIYVSMHKHSHFIIVTLLMYSARLRACWNDKVHLTGKCRLFITLLIIKVCKIRISFQCEQVYSVGGWSCTYVWCVKLHNHPLVNIFIIWRQYGHSCVPPNHKPPFIQWKFSLILLLRVQRDKQ